MAFNIATPAWRLAGTNGQPVKLRMPDGSWRTYGGGHGVPLKQKQPDGSWRVVSTEGLSLLWWIVAGDSAGGPQGEIATLVARHGPDVSGSGAVISSDPWSYFQIPPAAKFAITDRQGSSYWSPIPLDGSTDVSYGDADGLTLFVVFSLPPFGPGAGAEDVAAIDIWHGDYRFQPTVEYTILDNSFGSGPYLNVQTSDAAGRFVWLQASNNGAALTTGYPQLLEIRYVAGGANAWTVRIGGVDKALDPASTLPGAQLAGSPFPVHDIGFIVNAIAGAPTKIYDIQLWDHGLTGDDLTAARAYFGARYRTRTGDETENLYWSQILSEPFDGPVNPNWILFGGATISGGVAVLTPVYYSGINFGAAIALPSEDAQIEGWSHKPPLTWDVDQFTISVGSGARPADFGLQIYMGWLQIDMSLTSVEIVALGAEHVSVTNNLGWMAGAFRITIAVDPYTRIGTISVDNGGSPSVLYRSSAALSVLYPTPTPLQIANRGTQSITILDVGT